MNRLPLFPRFIAPICAAFCLAAALSGCRSNAPAVPPESSTPANTKVYHLRGRVVSTDPATGRANIDGEAIPGFMEAMVMPYKLRQPNLLSELHPGDTITADVLVSDTDTLLDSIVVVAQAKADYKPPIFYHVPKQGDAVPDFALLNQSGKQIHLADFRGKALLVTFIYTRCPLADFCPRMSHNFAKIDQLLAEDKGLYGKTHLLSISFDPDYDTPAVLKSYGGAYTGKYTQEQFAHWDFAAPRKAELADVAKFFDLGVTPEEDKTITHSLSTTLITPEGKVYRFYPGNDWDPADVVKDVKSVLAGKG